MDRSLNRVSSEVKTFDEDLIRQLLERIKVINEGRFEVHYKSGIEWSNGLIITRIKGTEEQRITGEVDIAVVEAVMTLLLLKKNASGRVAGDLIKNVD